MPMTPEAKKALSAAIRGLRAIFHGFAGLEAAEGYKMALSHDESYRRLIEAYLDGLGAPAN